MRPSLILAAICVLGLLGEKAHAQTRPSHYVPARPTISPYFAYSAINTTGLPNYYTYIQPLQQQTQLALAAQADPRQTLGYDNRIAFTERSLGEALDRQLRQRSTTGAGAPATAATFQDYGHFYPSMPKGGRR